MAVASLRIDGLRCDDCARAVASALRNAAGVTRVEVSLEPATARVDFDESKTVPAALAAIIREEGFGATLAG